MKITKKEFTDKILAENEDNYVHNLISFSNIYDDEYNKELKESGYNITIDELTFEKVEELGLTDDKIDYMRERARKEAVYKVNSFLKEYFGRIVGGYYSALRLFGIQKVDFNVDIIDEVVELVIKQIKRNSDEASEVDRG